MKYLINLIIILSLFTQVSHAQRTRTVEEYKVLSDSIATLIKLVEKDSISYAGMSFSEFVKQLEKLGLDIMHISLEYNSQLLYPQHVYGVMLWFLTQETRDFARANNLSRSYITVYFTESKPYEKAIDLHRKYQGNFEEEVAAFYGDAIVHSLYFHRPKDIYLVRRTVNKQIEKVE